MDSTGSNGGTEKELKMSLLSVYHDIIITNMDTFSQQYSRGGTKKIVIVNQEDGAGPYHDKVYTQFMADKLKKRDWLIFNQSSQLPVLNICDFKIAMAVIW